MPKPKRDDEAAKIDREVLRVARAVAALRGITLAEYLSERLRPLVLADHEAETRKVHEQHGSRAAEDSGKKRKGSKE
jgi:hypothetical protein